MQVITCIILSWAATTAPSASLPVDLDLDPVRQIVVQHNGRYMPLDTLARDVVRTVTSSQTPDDRDPVALLLAWNFIPQTWMTQPLINIGNAELRRELRLPADQIVFSYSELAGHEHLRQLIRDLAQIPGDRKLDPLESKVADINEKLVTFQQVVQGSAVQLVPNSQDPTAPWLSLDRLNPENPQQGRVRALWDQLQAAFVQHDRAAFAETARQMDEVLRGIPAGYRPTTQQIGRELRYNRSRPFRTAWILMVAAALVSAIAMGIRRRWFDAIAMVGLLSGFVWLSYGLWLRWHIAGRIPASNMFESLLFLSWGMGAFAIVAMAVQRQRIIPLTASAMGAVALMLADLLPIDGFIRPVPPVLRDTIWMSIHVPVIMVSYSVLALAVLFAHLQLLTMVIARRRRQLIEVLDGLHYWYVHVGSLLLLAGIVTGSMWAASSWGRYWGWDPKEVWSLVALLGYLAILHVRIDQDRVPPWAYVAAAVLAAGVLAMIAYHLQPLSFGKVAALAATWVVMLIFVLTRGPFATAVKSIFAFWMIIMTYVGVNYVLGIGLHSYGFGTGAVASRMLLFGTIDLGVVALCGLIYLAQQRSSVTPATSVAVSH